MSEKLPNLWVERPHTLGSGSISTASIHSFGNAASPTAALYIPAQRIRDLVETRKQRLFAGDVRSDEKFFNELEALIEGEK